MSVLADSIGQAARDFADRPAFVTPKGRAISFAQLEAASADTANGLLARGVSNGSVVALLLPSGVDYAAIYLGAARVGAATAGINPLLTPPEVRRCLRTVHADLLVVHHSLTHLLDARPAGRAETVEVLETADSPVCSPGRYCTAEGETVEVLETADSPVLAGGTLRTAPAQSRIMSLPHANARSPKHQHATQPLDTPPRMPESAGRDGPPVCICFTSATTGMPKAAWFTDRQLQAVTEIDGAGWGGGAGVASTQFAHVGFMTKLPWMLASGRTMHLLDRWSAGTVLELTARHRMSAVTGVAPHIALMVRHPLARRLDFSAVQAVIAGGAPSPPELVRAAIECFDARYSIRYSSTESGGVGLSATLDKQTSDTLHFAGQPRAGVSAEVRGPSGEALNAGETGELWLKSDAVMSGYWRDPQATAAALQHGWLRTGDLASQDSRGLFHLAGRVTEMFIRGGYNVYPLEVESVLAAHPKISEVAVVGRPDPIMGEIGLAVVAPHDLTNPPTLQDLRGFAASSLARHKLPEALEIVRRLPRNSAGKIDRARLA